MLDRGRYAYPFANGCLDVVSHLVVQYLEAARPVWSVYGAASKLGMLNHSSGHRPNLEATRVADEWLVEQFDLNKTQGQAAL